jgi:ribose transport system substrate-binding protein
VPLPITGLGPHGERAAPPSRVALSPDDVSRARERGFRVAVVLHTLASDWAREQLQAIAGTLGDCGVALVDVVDCGFAPEAQIAALDRLVRTAPDAIISLPVANATVAAAHARVAAAGIALVLLDNVPTGLLPGRDYVALVSADNSGLGCIAAELMAAQVEPGAEIGLLGYGADFFATDEREIAFGQWMRANRPDLRLRVDRFPSIREAGQRATALCLAYPAMTGLFVVWDTPALEVAKALEHSGSLLPIVTVDLGQEVAVSLATRGPVTAVAAQLPNLQGRAVAQATVLSMLERPVPDWIALPGLAVTRMNLLEGFQVVWRRPAPREVLLAMGQDHQAS